MVRLGGPTRLSRVPPTRRGPNDERSDVRIVAALVLAATALALFDTYQLVTLIAS